MSQETSLDTGKSQQPYIEFNQKVMRGELKFTSFDGYINALKAAGLIGDLTGQEREALRSTYQEVTGNSS